MDPSHMNQPLPDPRSLLAEIERLNAQLSDALQLTEAIRSGAIDALVVPAHADGGMDKVFTLEGSDQAYRTLIEAMNEAAITLSNDGTVLYCNGRTEELLGHPLAEIVGESFLQFVAGEDTAVFEALFANGASGSSRGEVFLVRKDGTRVCSLVSMKSLQPNGVPAVCLIVADLTDQKRDQELLAAERLARSVIEQASEAIVVCDGAGTVLRASRGAERLCEQNPIFKSFDSVFALRRRLTPPGAPLSAPVDFMRVRFADLCGKDLHGIDARLVGRDGENIDLLVSVGSLRGTDGEVSGCVFTLTDVSQQKRMAEALVTSNQDLEQFAYIASHDLQEPLRMVTSYLSLLRRRCATQLDPKAQDYVEHAVNGAKRMHDLVRGLLDFSKVSKSSATPSALDLDAILAEVIETLQPSIQESGATVTVDPLPRIVANRLAMIQLFQNLIGNALKFRGDRSPCVHVSASRSADGWTFSVKDNGIGIDPAQQGRLFTVFQRLHTREEYAGTGIGLAVCKKIVERQGGRIWIESQLGQGATFCFTQPEAPATALGVASPSSAA